MEKVQLRRPFGNFSPMIRQMDYIAQDGEFDVRARLLDFFRAADRYGVKVILSSWYYLHTNWYFDEEINRPLFDLSTEEKIAYFGDELDRILTFLREHGLLHCVAFAEIFNEFDGLPFAGEYDPTALSEEEAEALRLMHEKAIDKLKAHHPDVLFAYDSAVADMREDLIPRNIDVLNFHNYYLWNVYQAFEKGTIINASSEPDIPEETAQYLKMELSTAEVAAEAEQVIRTGVGWIRRVRLYADIDPDKMDDLEMLLEKEIADKYDVFLEKLKTKRYAHARLSRLCTHALLDMDAALVGNVHPSYVRLLGLRREAADLTAALRQSAIPIIAKAADGCLEDPLYQLDLRAYDLWALGAGLPSGLMLRQGVAVI